MMLSSITAPPATICVPPAKTVTSDTKELTIWTPLSTILPDIIHPEIGP
jgi:hypothetical protein